MILGVCSKCGIAVWEFNISLAHAILTVQRDRGFGFVHGCWNGVEWICPYETRIV